MLLLRLLFLHEGFRFVAFEPLLDSLLSENKQTNKQIEVLKLSNSKFIKQLRKAKQVIQNVAKFYDDQKREVYKFSVDLIKRSQYKILHTAMPLMTCSMHYLKSLC